MVWRQGVWIIVLCLVPLVAPFSVVECEHSLQQLSHLGSRPATDPRQFERTQKYLQHTMASWQSLARENGWHIMVDEIPVSGENVFLGTHFVYRNLTQTVILLTPTSAKFTGKYFMMNSHTDTAVGSPGTSDDGISVAISLETAHSLLQTRGELYTRGLLLLVNHGEEIGLLGSHGFVTHPLSRHYLTLIEAFMNLEAAGVCGPESLFQASPETPDLVHMYAASAPSPVGSILAQDLFRSGLIPSYTDFQIFTEEGGLYGIDLALYRHGYLYHTPGDAMEFLCPGTVAHFGQNVYAFVETYLQQSPTPLAVGRPMAIFTDVLGLFMVSYDQVLAATMACIVVSGALLRVTFSQGISSYNLRERIKSWCLSLGTFVVIVVLAWGYPLAMSFVIAKWLHWPMLWFSYPVVAILMYAPLLVAGMIHGVQLMNAARSRLRMPVSFENVWFTLMMMWVLLLCMGYFFDVGSAFVALMYATAFLVGSFLPPSWRFVVFLLPTLILMNMGFQVLETLVPISGRARLSPVDIVVSGVVGVVGLVLLHPLLPRMMNASFQRQQFMRKLSWWLIVASVMMVLVASFWLPIYTRSTPKRLAVQYVSDLDTREGYILFVPADSIPLEPSWLPLNAFPQSNELASSHRHALLPTIPSLRPDEGGRWELSTTFLPAPSALQFSYSATNGTDNVFLLRVQAPGAFGVELSIHPLDHVVRCGSISDKQFQQMIDHTKDDCYHIRFYDGESRDEPFQVELELSDSVTLEVYAHFIDHPTVALSQVEAATSMLPEFVLPVGSVMYKQSVTLAVES